VPKVKKSARGKHRWIGFQLDVEEYSRRSCEDFFSNIFEEIPWKLFDFKIINGTQYGILKVPLEHYLNAKDLVNQQEFSSTITSSGKIKLVRHRIGLK
jgi:hypothetical protein